jgi:hypothetical protein
MRCRYALCPSLAANIFTQGHVVSRYRIYRKHRVVALRIRASLVIIRQRIPVLRLGSAALTVVPCLHHSPQCDVRDRRDEDAPHPHQHRILPPAYSLRQSQYAFAVQVALASRSDTIRSGTMVELSAGASVAVSGIYLLYGCNMPCRRDSGYLY